MKELQLIIYRIVCRIQGKLNNSIINDFEFRRLLQRIGKPFHKTHDSLIVDTKVNSIETILELKRFSSDGQVFKQIILEEEYKYVINLIQENDLSLKSMLDFGMNIGLTSVYFSRFFLDLKIKGYEINKDTLDRAKQNFELNQLSTIECFHEGVWSQNTELYLDNNFRDGQDWSNQLSSNASGNKIHCKSISEIINKQHVDFVKIDIEGGEFELFKSTEYVDSWLPFVQLLAIEIHPEVDDPNIILNHLQRLNFKLYLSGELVIAIQNKAHEF